MKLRRKYLRSWQKAS